jgi:hypothetical protein
VLKTEVAACLFILRNQKFSEIFLAFPWGIARPFRAGILLIGTWG